MTETQRRAKGTATPPGSAGPLEGPQWDPQSPGRAGRVRELTKSSRSKFKIVWRQFNADQFIGHQLVWKVRSVQLGTGNKCLCSVRSVQFIQFISRTLPALARIDLAGSVRFRLGSVHRISNCLGGAEEQF